MSTYFQIITTTASITSLPSPSITTVTSGAPTSTVPLPTSSNHTVSGGAIAGAVVGPICGVALLLGLAFLCLRRRRSNLPSAEPSTHGQPPNQGLGATFGSYGEGKPEPDLHAKDIIRPMSIPPAYPGLEKAGPNIPMNEMTTHTRVIGVPLQPEVGVQQQVGSHQVPRRPVAAELGTNPQVTGMPPELPASPGFVV